MNTNNSINQTEMLQLMASRADTLYQEASDDEKSYIRHQLQELLRSEITTVTFTKSDGTLRNMKCTLNYAYIPEDKQPKKSLTNDNLAESAPQINTLRVFDLEKKEWRSFRYDRLKTIRIDLNK